MASKTGHAKNVANFENLVSIVQSFGAAYNPPRTNLPPRPAAHAVGGKWRNRSIVNQEFEVYDAEVIGKISIFSEYNLDSN